MHILKPSFIGALLLTVVIPPELLAESDINIPFRYARGQVLYEMHCSSCHGVTMAGTEKGPPLLHAFYKPSHHNDASFYKAALKGVRAHHWEFGDMPAVNGMTQKKMQSIVPFIRYYQQQKKLY